MPVAVGLIADSYKAPAGAFTPAGLTALAAWYDATDASTFTTTTNDQFTQWRDKSANAFHLTPENGSHVNLRRQGSINGVVAVINDHPSGATMACIRTGTEVLALLDSSTKMNCMNFAVCKLNASPGVVFGLVGATYRCNYQGALGTTSNYLDVVNASGGRVSSTTVGLAINIPYLISWFRNGANMELQVNGVVKMTKASASGSALSQTGPLQLMGGGTNFGHLGEVIHVARYDATDYTSTVNYLTAKWGIGTFTPAQIAGLQGWWDASDAATITSSGGLVSAWNDKSGNNRHFTQATGTAQPQTAVTTINSRNVLTFDGTTDYMDTAATTLHNTTSGEWSSFVVCRPTIISGTRMVFDHDRGTGANTQRGPSFLKLSTSTPQAVAYSTTPTAFADSGAAYTANAPHVFAAVRGATTVELWTDTVSAGSTATTGTPNNTTSTIGCRVGGNDAVTPTQFLQGDLAEVIVYNVALSTTDRQTVENYLKTKWGIP